MRQAWVVARKDLREMVRDGRVRVVGIGIALTLAVAAGSATQQARQTAREKADAREAERARWLGQGEVNPHAAAHYGTFVFAPAEPLAIIDPGVTRHVAAAVFLEAHRQQVGRNRPVDDAPTTSTAGDLSIAGCLQVLAPLFLLLLGTSAVARERQRGTWNMLRASGIGEPTLIAGKAMAVATALLAVIVPALLMGAIMAGTAGDLTIDADSRRRGALMLAAYAVYLSTWLVLALSVSVRSRSSQRALLIGATLWLAWCVVMPPALMTLAAMLVRTPSVAAFTAALDDERATRPSWDDRVAAATDRFLSGDDLPAASNPEVVALIDTEAADTELFGRHLDALAESFARQEATYRWLSLVSPTSAMHITSMTLAGTDYSHHRHFERAAAGYRTTLLAALNDDLAAFDAWKTFSAASNRDLWARVPEFDYDTPPVSWALGQIAGPALSLAGWFLVATAWLAWRFRRAGAP